MPLNTSGPISLDGATTGSSISVETEYVAATQISINDTRVRRITGKTTSNSSISFTDFYGKYYRAYTPTAGPSAYVAVGSYSYTVPANVTSLTIKFVGGGGAGQGSYFNGGSWTQVSGSAGGSSVVTNGTWTATANGGGGGNSASVGGTVSISGANSTTLNQTGGDKVTTTGGSSYDGAGSAQGGDFSKPATPTYGAGGGGGYQFDGPTNYGGSAGGTGIAVFPVTPGQTINIFVGAGAIGSDISYTKGSNHGSYCGSGGSGYVSITPNNATITNYSYISQQGGLQNGGGSCLAGGDPSYATDQNGGWRAGDPLWPTAYQNNGLSCQYWGVTLDANSTSSISYLRTLVTSGQMAAAFTSVTSIAADGSGSSFTAILNSNYYLYSFNAATSVCIMNTGRQVTFYADSSNTSIYYGNLGRGAGQTTLIAFNSGGCLWKNDSGAPGQVNVNVNAVGVGKFGNFRIQVDGIVVYTGTNGDTGCGGKNYGDVTVGPYTITSSSCILVEQYWWGCGNFQYGVNYISGGSYQIKGSKDPI